MALMDHYLQLLPGLNKYMCTYKKNVSYKISEHFDSKQFDCHGSGCCSQTEVDPKLVEYLEMICNEFEADVTINSAYRCTKHNKKIGGASKSKHLYGQAADIKVKGVAPLKVAQYAESIGIKGIGQYSNFVHIDTRTNKYFWYGDNQSSRSTFGKYTSSKKTTSESKQTESDTNTAPEGMVVITGQSVNIRKGPGTKYGKYSKTARKGETYKTAKTDGWIPIEIGSAVYWISEKYAK